MLTKVGDILLTDKKDSQQNLFTLWRLIPSVVQCHMCYIWMDKSGLLLSRYFFLQLFVCIYLHPSGCPYSPTEWLNHWLLPLLRAHTQHGCWGGNWILLCFWICICTWYLAFLCVSTLSYWCKWWQKTNWKGQSVLSKQHACVGYIPLLKGHAHEVLWWNVL